jgi:pSer/pThr/pTyr-binding forkhead associated (FHA) protein
MGDDARATFSGACGLGGPLLVRIEGSGAVAAAPLEFHKPHLIIGRDESVDVVLEGAEVSRRHAYLQVFDDRLFCVDLGSRTGVRWGDDPRPVGWVEPGQGIGIGPYRLRFEGVAPGTGEHPPISRSFAWSPVPDVRIEFNGPGSSSALEPWQISRALVLVGRSAVCRLRLEGGEIASIHAAIVRTPSGVWVVDLLGPGGVTVGGASVRACRLEDGDKVGVGGHRFWVRVGSAARPTSGKGLARWSTGRVVRTTSARLAPPRGPDAAVTPAAGPEVASLLAEFDRMHQRTSEQFQQAILMMFKMHQDQMAVIRDELSRIDRLEEELRSLQAEQARVAPLTPSRVALRLVEGEDARPAAPAAGTVPVRPAPRPDVATPVRADSTSPAGTGPRPAADHDLDDDPHARLSRRLADLQAERRGLWKKLLGSMTGDEAGRLLP